MSGGSIGSRLHVRVHHLLPWLPACSHIQHFAHRHRLLRLVFSLFVNRGVRGDTHTIEGWQSSCPQNMPPYRILLYVKVCPVKPSKPELLLVSCYMSHDGLGPPTSCLLLVFTDLWRTLGGHRLVGAASVLQQQFPVEMSSPRPIVAFWFSVLQLFSFACYAYAPKSRFWPRLFKPFYSILANVPAGVWRF